MYHVRQRFPASISTFLLGAALALLLAPMALAAADAADPEVSDDDRRGITAALQAKIGTLLEQKNEDGVPNVRGSYSKSFRRVDEDTYLVGFHEITAGEHQMVTQRFDLTLKRQPSGAWEITDEELKDRYDGLYRGVPGDENFQRFDSFQWEREGMSVRATSGYLYRDVFQERPVRFVLVSEGLRYTFQPPLAEDQLRYKIQLAEREKYLVFEPQLADFYCDPATCEEILVGSFSGLAPAKYDELPATIRKEYDEWKKETLERRRENVFSGFFPLPEPEHRLLSATVETFNEDRGFALYYDNWEAEEVSVWATGVGQLTAYYAEETRAEHVSMYELERRDDRFGRDYELHRVKGEVEMALDQSDVMTGDLTFDITTKRDLERLTFRVSQLRRSKDQAKEARNPRMRVNSIQMGDGEEMTWVKTGNVSGFAILPEKIPTGTRMTVRMQFENRETLRPLSPSHTYVDRGGWMPFVRFGDFIDDFDLVVKVPEGYTTLGVGKRIEDRNEDGMNITRWVPDSPVAFPSVIFGKYRSASSKVKATKLDGTEIPVNIYIDKLSMSSMLTYLVNVPDGFDLASQGQSRGIAPGDLPGYADQAANSLNLYREIYGVDYPYSKLDLVNDPMGAIGFFYGQAPGSLIYLGYAVFRSEGALGDLGGTRLAKFGKSVIAHEVAHQWWGSLITNSNFRNYWFVESLAEYSSALYTEARYGKKAYYDHVEDWRQEIMDADLKCSVQDATFLSEDFADYRAAVYSKGPYMFHVMRMTWGDEQFFPYLKQMAQDLAGREIVSRDIQHSAEKALGGDMGWFFDQWLRGVGMPEYTFTYDVRQTEDGMYLVEGTVDQRILVGDERHEVEGQVFVAVVPVTVEVKGGQTFQKKVVLEGPSTRFAFKVPDKPKSVELNKYGESLAWDVIEKKQGA